MRHQWHGLGIGGGKASFADNSLATIKDAQLAIGSGPAKLFRAHRPSPLHGLPKGLGNFEFAEFELRCAFGFLPQIPGLFRQH
jgi:hypothetical protein